MGPYRSFMHYVRSFIFKMHIGVIRPKIRVRNEISRFLEILEFEYFPFASFGFDPGFEQLRCAAAQSIFQIKKMYSGSL